MLSELNMISPRFENEVAQVEAVINKLERREKPMNKGVCRLAASDLPLFWAYSGLLN